MDSLQEVIFLALAGLLTNGIAYNIGFLRRPFYPRPPVRWVDLISVFVIYLGFLFLLPLLMMQWLKTLSISGIVTVQACIIIAMLSTLFFYIRTEGKNSLMPALKNPESSSSILKDFGIGVLVWSVAYPWVGVISQIFDFLLEFFFHFKSYEQVAVKYLRDNLESAPQFMVALLSIVVIAPLVEEFLFRGTLQQILKKYFSIKTSIVLTAIIFACFHFSPTQNLGNLSLIPSLFAFACFLGYLYERQGSIWASVGLHLTFNLISSLQIIFFS